MDLSADALDNLRKSMIITRDNYNDLYRGLKAGVVKPDVPYDKLKIPTTGLGMMDKLRTKFKRVLADNIKQPVKQSDVGQFAIKTAQDTKEAAARVVEQGARAVLPDKMIDVVQEGSAW